MAAVVILPNYRGRYRVPLVEEGELFCSPHAEQEAGQWVAPLGYYDVGAFLKTVPAGWRDPSLLVVYYDQFEHSLPRELTGVKCPRVLVMGDMHHMERPLQKALQYALCEPFDVIIVEYTRQHIHFFLEAGLHQTRWLPSFSLTPFEHVPSEKSLYEVMFVGTLKKHRHRVRVIKALQDRGLQVHTGTGPSADTAKVYSESLINLNVSLNGDLNLRVFEILAAGGFLVTDRLSPESGLSLLFEEGRELVSYKDADHLYDVLQHYRSHPEEARRIAAAGHEAYLERHRARHKMGDLLALVEGRQEERYDMREEPRTRLPAETGDALANRIGMYEMLQESQLNSIFLKILFWTGMERAATDAVDLMRVQVSVMEAAGGTQESALQRAGLGDRVRWLDRTTVSMQADQWHLVVCRQKDLEDPLFQRLRENRSFDQMAVLDMWEARPIRPFLRG